MWHWDQGRLAYFQFDALRQIASFIKANDFKTANRVQLLAETGLTFQAPPTHSPWRNYSRILKLCLLVSEVNGFAQPTPVADILSQAGLVTCDEYLHFLVSAFTEPSPALEGWRPDAKFRYSLLFSLKYLWKRNIFAAQEISVLKSYQRASWKGSENWTTNYGLW